MASLKTFEDIGFEAMNRENGAKTTCKDDNIMSSKKESGTPTIKSSKKLNIKHTFALSTCCTESNSGNHSQESKKFVIQSLLGWLIICIPGNVVAAIILYAHYASENRAPDKSQNGNGTNNFGGIPNHKLKPAHIWPKSRVLKAFYPSN